MNEARHAFRVACALDVAVAKPGNVSVDSPGHGMDAGLFLASSEAAAGPLFDTTARVGTRIERAIEATWATAACNTNLGIVLLCAPIACAAQRLPPRPAPRALQAAIEAVLSELDVADANAAFRAIARASPGGLGEAKAQDVRAAATVDLRAAMSLAAERDRIARQYRDGFAELFEHALPLWPFGFPPPAPSDRGRADGATSVAVQGLYMGLLARWPDSHIVRKHGDAVAQNVMTAAQQLRGAAPAELAAWDRELKQRGINPGTTADLTVATLMLAGSVALEGLGGMERDI